MKRSPTATEGIDIFTEKQQRVLRETTEKPHRYNICVGAVRSGKTYLDFFRIPIRLRALGKGENAVFIGNTMKSVERNIISPMREIWGPEMVGRVHGGAVELFGRRCILLGADRSDGAEKIQGLSIGYAYGDEITTWNEEVFRMIQSRLDREDSVFDGSCNPGAPNHWFRKFLDSGADIHLTEFTLDDNPTLPESFVKQLKDEYRGTVYYDRFILGKWRSCDSIIYRGFADSPDDYIISTVDPRDIIMADVGVDFGGNGSAHAFNLTGYTAGYRKIITLDEYYCREIISPARLENDFVEFISRCKRKYPRLYDVYCDSAEQVLIRGLRNAAQKAGLRVCIHNAAKKPISDRICFYSSLMAQHRYFIMDSCSHTIDAFMEAEYDREGGRKDDGSSNIDSLDAQEYSTEHRMNDILDNSQSLYNSQFAMRNAQSDWEL